MKQNFIFSVITMVFVVSVISSYGQSKAIGITTDVDPEVMVENIVGEGIQYNNVTYKGADVAHGTFVNGSTTNLGINNGIWLSSGSGYFIPGPNNSSSSGANNGKPGDGTLSSITTAATKDASVLEFDFIPESDTLRFRYVFGSEEYNEWVANTYNDVFGFFVTGPNPEGGSYSNKNIALIPGTDPPMSVNIHNVNWGDSDLGAVSPANGVNPDYFKDNTGGLTLQYDGLTVVLTAYLKVVGCQTYHIKIGVADAGDGIYDTGVFLEQNSFESPKIEIDAEPYPEGVSDNMVEGCVEADLIFKLPNESYAPTTVSYNILTVDYDGKVMATNGVDYGIEDEDGNMIEVPLFVEFEEGEMYDTLHLVTAVDNYPEGIESIVIVVENDLGCTVRYDTVEFTIIDYQTMIAIPSGDVEICHGDTADIGVYVLNGISPYTYDWVETPEEDESDSISVNPYESTMYHIQVWDMCQDTVMDSVQVTVYPFPEVDIGEDTTICEGESFLLDATGDYEEYLWQDGSTEPVYLVPDSGIYHVTVSAEGGCASTDTLFVDLSVFTIDIGDSAYICADQPPFIFDPGEFESYLWQDDVTTSQTYAADQTGYYSVTVTNEHNCTANDSAYLFVSDSNESLNKWENTYLCHGDGMTLAPNGVWDEYMWQDNSTGTTYWVSSEDIPGTYTYKVKVKNDCGVDSVSIKIDHLPPLIIDLGPDTTICHDEYLLLDAGSQNSWSWNIGAATQFLSVSESGEYSVDVVSTKGCDGEGSVNVKVAGIVNLGNDTAFCEGDTLILDAGFSFDNYLWSTGETTQAIDVTSEGTFKVNVYHDDGEDGCPSDDFIVVLQYPQPLALITGIDEICTGDSVTLTGSDGDYKYFWDGISGSQTYSVTKGGTYNLTVSNYCGEDNAPPFTVTEFQLPLVDLGDDVVLFPGESITLDAGGDYETIEWNHSGASERYYSVTFENADLINSVYQVEVFDGHCKNSDEVIIEIFIVDVPIVVTPNGDDKNDRFHPRDNELTGVKDHTIVIFNRWSQKVWESTDFESGWDGKQNGKVVADGTYFWVLEVTYGDNNNKKVYKGSVTLLGGSGS